MGFAITCLIANLSASQVNRQQELLNKAIMKPYGDLTTCLADINTIVTDAEAVEADLKEPTIKHLLDAVKEVTDIVSTAKQALTDCQKSIVSTQRNGMVEMIAGMMKPFGLSFNIQALIVCVGEEDKALLVADASYQMIQEAIANKEYAEIIPAGIFLFAAFKQAQQGLPACEAIATETWTTQTPIDSLSMSDINVDADVTAFINAFKGENFLEAGEFLGEIMKGMESKVAAVEDSKLDRRMTTEIMQGFLEGANVGTFNFTNLLICIYEADQTAEIVYQDVEIFEEAWADKDPMEAIGGVIAAIAAVQQLKQTIPICESVDARSMNWTDFDKIVSTVWAADSHMDVVERDIVMNGNTITKEVEAAAALYHAKEYKQFGFTLASALEQATHTRSRPSSP
jgi:hypothetical protein